MTQAEKDAEIMKMPGMSSQQALVQTIRDAMLDGEAKYAMTSETATRIIEIVRAHDAKQKAGENPEGKIRIGDFTISDGFAEGAIWINRQDGEGGSFSLKDFESHIEEFYQKHF
jgi:hypothetical protein